MRDRLVRLATQKGYLLGQICSRIDVAFRLRDQIRTTLGRDGPRGDAFAATACSQDSTLVPYGPRPL